MNFKIKTLRFRSGEEIQIRQTEDGRYVCPICGFVAKGDLAGKEDPPYAESQLLHNGQRVGPIGAVASFNICPVCYNEYGCDDSPKMDEPQSVNWKWRQLRCQWLRGIEITDEVKEQLRNLDLNPEEEIRLAREGTNES